MTEADAAGWIQIAIIVAVFVLIINHGDDCESDPGFCIKHGKPMQWRGWYPGENGSFCDLCEWEQMEAEDEENKNRSIRGGKP